MLCRLSYTHHDTCLDPARLPPQPAGKEPGAPGPVRTGDLRLRRPLLYPTELRAHPRRRPAHRPNLHGDGHSGAGDEARTRDIQLGRLMLYQLSYARPHPFRAHPAPSPTTSQTPAAHAAAQTWSGRPDLNRRPSGPKPDALAKLRHAPFRPDSIISIPKPGIFRQDSASPHYHSSPSGASAITRTFSARGPLSESFTSYSTSAPSARLR